MYQPSQGKRLIVAVTGASGMWYAIRLIEVLTSEPNLEIHLVLSEAAKIVMEQEALMTASRIKLELQSVVDRTYLSGEVGAPPASGSWPHDGMVVCPCSMASLAAIATGVGTNLIHRAADVTLKEKRPLILVTRETPLNRVHLENMLAAHKAGATIMPACPGFYHSPESIEELVDHLVGRILDHLDVPKDLTKRWGG